MKKILIVSNDMNVGGIQKALLEFLKALSIENKFEISLFCCNLEGEYLDRIPKDIKILEENKLALISELSVERSKKLGFKYFFCKTVFSLWSKIFSKKLPSRVLCKLIGKFDKRYDIAISYSQPIEEHIFSKLTNEIVLNCVDADKKLSFVHCDFSSYGGNTKLNRKLYEKFDGIVAVSDSVGNRIKEIIPQISKKVHTVYNFCDCQEILAMAEQNPVVYKKKTLITVARLGKEKGLMRCIPVFSKLRKLGYDFEWHIVGDGPLKCRLEEAIIENDLSDNVFLEGKQTNPYRYMKNASYFLLPSHHEAAPIVFDEALTLGIPVLTTNTLSAVEMIEKKGAGFVCENEDNAIFEMIKSVFDTAPTYNTNFKPQKEIRLAQFDGLCK